MKRLLILALTLCAAGAVLADGIVIPANAAAQVKSADATNCVVVGDAADVAQFIYVIGVGVAP